MFSYNSTLFRIPCIFMYSLSKLDSGLPVMVAPTTGTSSVTVMVFAGAGSRYEKENERGISHFLEHMFFKGGKKYPTTKDVSSAIDGVGGDFNAFTGKEYAGYYVKVASSKAELACDVLSDMLLSATFPQEEIEKERGVILEEERMYQDTPMYRAGWDFEQLLYGNHPLGWDTIGTEQVINSVNQADFQKHKDALYTPDNAVVVFAGNIKEADALKLAEHYFGGLSGKKGTEFNAFTTYDPEKVFLRTKQTEQSHLVLGVPGLPARHEDHFAMKVLSTILGGNMSSRMFLRIREAHGLCYYIHGEVDTYLDAGCICTSAGVDQSRLEEAVERILHEYQLCADKGVDDDEITKAKEYLRGKMVLGLEDSEELAHYFGRQQLLYPEVYDLDQYFAELAKVTKDQVNDLAKRVLKREEMRLCIVGKEDDKAKWEQKLGR